MTKKLALHRPTKVNHAPTCYNCCLEWSKWCEGQIQDSCNVCEESYQNFKNKALHKLQFLGLVSLFTAQSSDFVTAFKLRSFDVYDYDEDSCFTNIQALVTEKHLYGSLAPERLLQILQLIQGKMVKSHRIHVEWATKLPK